MIHQGKKGVRVHRSLAGSDAGDTYTGQAYGDDVPCGSCGGKHPIYETQQVYEVARTIVDCIIGGPTMMLGVLRSNDGQWVAACSPADGTPGYNAFRGALTGHHKRFLPALVIAGNIPDDGSRSFGGLPLAASFIRSCTVQNAPIAGRCAAPKLVHYAIRLSLPRPWTMSEVLYDPAGSNPNYTDYLTAPSCATCGVLLPQLLCPLKASATLKEFTGLIRNSWGGSW